MSGFGPVGMPPPPPPRTVGQIVGAAFRLYGRWWRTLVPIAAVVVIPTSVAQEWLGWQLATARWQRLALGDASDRLDRLAMLSLVLAVVVLVAYLALQGALTWAGARALAGRGTSLREAYGAAGGRIGGLVAATLLAALAVLVGFVLLVIPAIYAAVRLFVFVPALMIERLGARRSLARSWDLVRGRWWPTLGALILAGLAMSPVSLVGSVVVLLSDSWLVRALAGGVASSIVAPFQGLLGVVLYLDLRQRKEGYTLAELEAELGLTAPGASERPGLAP